MKNVVGKFRLNYGSFFFYLSMRHTRKIITAAKGLVLLWLQVFPDSTIRRVLLLSVGPAAVTGNWNASVFLHGSNKKLKTIIFRQSETTDNFEINL